MTRRRETALPDAPLGNWVDRRAPAAFRPYLKLARFDRPIGTWLLLWPCWWSLALAAALTQDYPDTRPWFGLPDLFLLALFGVGALVMRGAGCVYNDIVDRDLDARVARTRERPLASGRVSPLAAWIFLVALALVGLAVLVTFNRFAVALGVASLALVAAYPFMKRLTWWPQAWLGLTFNYGALLGWAAATGDIAWPAVATYLAGICWTLGYDTIYAHQDLEDDALVGIRSSARWLGERSRVFVLAIYAATVVALALAGGLAQLGVAYWPILAIAAFLLGRQALTVDLRDPIRCLAAFRSNHGVGAVVFSAIVLGSLTA
jgi:4-hydroxybenzoate polyprenyltransferase